MSPLALEQERARKALEGRWRVGRLVLCWYVRVMHAPFGKPSLDSLRPHGRLPA